MECSSDTVLFVRVSWRRVWLYGLAAVSEDIAARGWVHYFLAQTSWSGCVWLSRCECSLACNIWTTGIRPRTGDPAPHYSQPALPRRDLYRNFSKLSTPPNPRHHDGRHRTLAEYYPHPRLLCEGAELPRRLQDLHQHLQPSDRRKAAGVTFLHSTSSRP